MLGDTDAEAREKAYEIRRQQVSGQTAIKFLEQLWNRDLSATTTRTARCPTIDPLVGENTIARGRASVRHVPRPAGHRRASGGRWPRPRTCRSGS